jgi:hypothetical protein
LKKIIAGAKSIEARFSKFRIPPYGRVRPGDILFLKEVAGPLRAITLASQVQYFGPLRPGEVERIMEDFEAGLQLDSDFKQRKLASRYATLIFLGPVLALQPIEVIKPDRRPWVVFG